MSEITKADFYKKVGVVVGMIPAGKVATYGQIAELIGLPGYSRHVGHALATGLKDEKGSPVPAHRVINSQGILSGAATTQQDRLEAEGVVFKGWRKVELNEYLWQPTWDDMLYIEDCLKEL